mgnify:FL=1
MKKLCMLMAMILCVSVSCMKMWAGNNDHDLEKVRDFYRQYAVAYSIKNLKASFAKCDSLLKIYCSETICKDTKDDRGGTGIYYDYATDDAGIDTLSVKTLDVKPVGNNYIVTYKRNAKDDRNRYYIRSIKLRVTVKGGKINQVKEIL